MTKENPQSLVGNRLREERHRLDITQADAALLCGVTREMWGRYERGAMPSAHVLVLLIGHGVDVNYILGGTRVIEDAGMLPARERELLQSFREMDEEGRSAITRAAAMELDRSRFGPQLQRQQSPAPHKTIKQVIHGNVGKAAGRDMTITAPAKKSKG
jgi:transcriptional regulator with XRE-family HTH domain